MQRVCSYKPFSILKLKCVASTAFTSWQEFMTTFICSFSEVRTVYRQSACLAVLSVSCLIWVLLLATWETARAAARWRALFVFCDSASRILLESLFWKSERWLWNQVCQWQKAKCCSVRTHAAGQQQQLCRGYNYNNQKYNEIFIHSVQMLTPP